jgi:hypothetical protein
LLYVYQLDDDSELEYPDKTGEKVKLERILGVDRKVINLL